MNREKVKRKDLCSMFLILLMLLPLLSFHAPIGFGATTVEVSVYPNTIVGTNKLSLGFMLDGDWKTWRDNPLKRQLAQQAGFKMIRFFTDKDNSPRPCAYWNRTTKTGTWDWTELDLLVRRIFEIGATPLVCLGGCRSPGQQTGMPPGMSRDPTTELAFSEDWTEYCAEWVRHFKKVGLPVKFYEIINEPNSYFAPNGWDKPNMTKVAYFTRLFNSAATKMLSENSNLIISHDFICCKPILTYWLANGVNVGSLNFHKYDEHINQNFTDGQMFEYAESKDFGTWPLGYSVTAAQQVYYDARGKLLPIINSESNFNSKCSNGTDPLIQQMTGSVWLALVLRMAILNNVSYNIYYDFSSSKSVGQTTPTGGFGFGMVNSDNGQPWYPYYANYMLGRNLAVGDSLVKTSSNSEDIRTLGWRHGQTLNLLLISKTNQTRTLSLLGLGAQLNVSRIDNLVPWQSPSIQYTVVNSDSSLILNGYSVVLMQTVAPIYSCDFEGAFPSDWVRYKTYNESVMSTNTQAASGTQSVRCSVDSLEKNSGEMAYIQKQITPLTEVYVQAYVRFDSLPSSGYFSPMNIRAQTASPGAIGWLEVHKETSGVVWTCCWRDSTAATTGTATISGVAINANQWYSIEIYVKVGSLGNGAVKYWIDGALVYQKTGIDNSEWPTGVQYMQFGERWSTPLTGAHSVYVDTVTVSSSYIP